MEKFHKEKLGKENIRSRKEDMKVTNQNDLPNSEKSQTSIYMKYNKEQQDCEITKF